jgi:hypothetical protein
MVFLTYETGSKAYKVFDPVTRRVLATRDAVFDESACWDWQQTGGDVNSDFVINYLEQGVLPIGSRSLTVKAPTEASVGSPKGPSEHPLGTSGREPAETSVGSPSTPHSSPEASTPTVEFVSPPTIHSGELDSADDPELTHRFRTMQNVLDYDPATEPDEELHFLAAEEPGSFTEAEEHATWRRAMLEEMEAIEDNKTWHLTTLPLGQRAIGLKWVYKVKKDALGKVLKHKARLVAKGYV